MASAAAVPSPISVRFAALDAFLHTHSALWRPRPFHGTELPWRLQHPELSDWLLARSDAEVDALEADAELLATQLARFIPELGFLPELTHIAALPTLARAAVPLGFEWGIDGRKWAQVEAFSAAVLASESTPSCTRYVDWCSGKAHLGRYIALQTQQRVLALERDPELVAAGQALAQRHALPVTLHTQDVLSPEVAVRLDADSHVLALHACGRLHLQLLRVATRRGVPRVSIAPCCHHLCAAPDAALSQQALLAAVRLTPDDMQLAVQETVTSGRSRQRARVRESAWRLGFDALQRCTRGVDAYLNVPSAPRAVLRGDFASFVGWAAARKQLQIPDRTDLCPYEALGVRLHDAVTRLALLRHAFRRALELWILCDRARFLEEAGYAVTLGVFCERAVTPRNLLLDARLDGGVPATSTGEHRQ